MYDETLKSLKAVMTFAKQRGFDDQYFEDFMAVSDWLQASEEKIGDTRLEIEIANIILGVANSYNEATTSDLQGMADVAAKRIVELLKSVTRSVD
jgi:hypothetical protein